MDSIEDFVKNNKHFVAAHRGSSGTAPENTLSAIREALNAGARLIESDIQITSDGHVIAFHDKAVSRTTNGIGFASKMKLDEIRKLDAGSWFNNDFKGEKVPLLSEIFDLIKDKAYINIEVKNIHSDTESDNIEKILELVEKYSYENYILFSSFYYNSLIEIKKYNPKLHTAAIRLPKDNTSPSDIRNKTGCEALVLSIEEINEEVSEDAEKNGIYLGVYSIDSIEQLDFVLKYSANALVTNYPALIVKELKTRKLISD